MSAGYRIAVIVSHFNRAITENLLSGARTGCEEYDIKLHDSDVYSVPGAFELPIVASEAAGSGRYDGVVRLGAVIRGETPHFDYVCDQAAAGILRVSLDSGVPVTFSVLTTVNVEQEMARAGGEVGNKGYEGVVGVVRTIDEMRRLRAGG